MARGITRKTREIRGVFRDCQLLSTLRYLLCTLISRAAASQKEATERQERYDQIKHHPAYDANMIDKFTQAYNLTKAGQMHELRALKTQIKNTKAQIALLDIAMYANANVVPADRIHKLTEAEDQITCATAEFAMLTERLKCLRALAVKRSSNAAQVGPVAQTSHEPNTADAKVRNEELLQTHNKWKAAQAEMSCHQCNVNLIRYSITLASLK